MQPELKQSTHTLGIAERNVIIYRFPVREFPQFRQDILETLVELKSKLKPDLVLLPSLGDTHQDHHTVVEEGRRAFKDISVFGYEAPWNLFSFAPSLYVALERKHIDKKIEAVSCYQSQKSKNYVNEEFLYAWARVKGVQAGCDYAEAFEVIRWILK